MCNAFIEGMTTNAFTGVDVLVTLILAILLGGGIGWMWREIKEYDKERGENSRLIPPPPVVNRGDLI